MVSEQREWSEQIEQIEETAPEEENEEVVEEEETVEAFPEEWREDFEGLAYLGHLEDIVRIPSHTFVIRTLKTGEKLEIALICKEFESSLGWNRAYKAACVAASLVLVDGKPIMVGDRTKSDIAQKYNYVVKTWYDPVIDKLYLELDRLESRQRKIMTLLGIYDEE